MATTSQVLPQRESRHFLAGGMGVVWAIALAKLLLHCYFNNRYGYFRDEFDYLACGQHLAWGYVDQPPLIPFLARVSRMALGESLRSVRFLPALASSLLVVQAAVFAREFGGRRFALLLSGVTVLVAPLFLANGSLLGTNCLEPNLWMGCAYFAILAIKRSEPRYWIWFGVVAGLGMEEKYSIAVFCFGIVVGLLLTEQRRVFAGKEIWLGGLAALLVFLPNLLWNVHNHWPFLELMRNIRAEHRDVVLSAPEFFLQQTLLIHPLTAPIWIAGLLALLFSARLKPYRFLGWSYLISYATFSVLHGKNYYLAPIYPMLLAAGAVVIESVIERRGRPWLKRALINTLLVGGAVVLPIVVPVLPVENFVTFLNHFPIKPPATEYGHIAAALPQHYADQFGWKEIVAETAVAWNRLAPAERGDCAVFAQDYGQAGAIDFLGRGYGLPPALSGHQTYFLWGPRGYSGNCMIILDDQKEKLDALFSQVEYVGTSADNPYALERRIPVFICRGAKFGSLTQLWPKLKKWR